MNNIEKLSEKLRARCPDLIAILDRPNDSSSSWWLDLELKGHSATVEWRPRQGFGVSSSVSDSYGEGPDEIYPDVDSTVERVTELMLGRQRTHPPKETVIQKLRESLRITQVELADRLHVNQAAVSKMERRTDVFISTLRAAVEAMGGSLEIRARFAEGVYRIVQFDDLKKEATAHDNVRSKAPS